MNKRWFSIFLSSCMALTLVPTAALAEEELVAEAPEIAEATAETPEVAEMNEEIAAAKLEEVTVEIPYEMKAAVNEDIVAEVSEAVAAAPEMEEIIYNESEAVAEVPEELQAVDTSKPAEETDAPKEILEESGRCGKNGANVTWTLANGVLTIRGEGAMRDYPSYGDVPWCNNSSDITTINIENGVTSIGSCAFNCCYSLESIEIPNSVTSIGDYAFYGCGSLESIEIPNSVTYIGSGAFYYCGSLESIEIPNGVTSIGGYVFYGCGSLTSIEIPNGVTTIGDRAFSHCNRLTSIKIPSSVTSIDDYAFNGCSELKDVYYAGTEADWMKITIGDANDPLFDATIHYNNSTTVDYSKVVPELVNATAFGSGVTLNWKSVKGLRKYRVYRKTVGTSWKKLKDVADTTYTDTTAQDGVRYTYTVRGMDGNTVVTSYNKKGLSVAYSVATAAPELYGAFSVKKGILVAWDAVGNYTKYRIYRKTATGNWVKLKDVTNLTNYVDTTAQSGTKYYYTVRGMDGSKVVTGYDKTGVSATK